MIEFNKGDVVVSKLTGCTFLVLENGLNTLAKNLSKKTHYISFLAPPIDYDLIKSSTLTKLERLIYGI